MQIKQTLFYCSLLLSTQYVHQSYSMSANSTIGQFYSQDKELNELYKNYVRTKLDYNASTNLLSNSKTLAALDIFNKILNDTTNKLTDISVTKIEKIGDHNEETNGRLPDECINLIFERMNNNNSSNLNIFVFNENFFGHTVPLSNEEYTSTAGRFKEFSRENKNAICHVNFLTENNEEIKKEELRRVINTTINCMMDDRFFWKDISGYTNQDIASCKYIKKLCSMLTEDKVILDARKSNGDKFDLLKMTGDFFVENNTEEITIKFYDGDIKTYKLLDETRPWSMGRSEHPIYKMAADYLEKQRNLLNNLNIDGTIQVKTVRNFSSTYHGGDEMTRYHKSSYYMECNDDLFINDKAVFMMGNGIDEKVSDTEMGTAIHMLISTQICSDVTSNTRCANEFKKDVFRENDNQIDSLLHVIASDGQVIRGLLQRHLPTGKLIIHSTSYDSQPGFYYVTQSDFRFAIPGFGKANFLNFSFSPEISDYGLYDRDKDLQRCSWLACYNSFNENKIYTASDYYIKFTEHMTLTGKTNRELDQTKQDDFNSIVSYKLGHRRILYKSWFDK